MLLLGVGINLRVMIYKLWLPLHVTPRCSCPQGFDGPRCQQTRHSFSGGLSGAGGAWTSFAWYPPLALCQDSHITLEFITARDNGVLLYHGPIREFGEGEGWDFLVLELRAGYPLLR